MNVLNHHIGISEAVGFVRPKGTNLCVFHDQRNDRGVIIAYADRNAEEPVQVALPLDSLIAEDIMGNPVPVSENAITLSPSGRPVVLYSEGSLPGKDLFSAVEPLDRKYLGFVTESGAGEKVYRLPETWEGQAKGEEKGNPVLSQDREIWRVDSLFPTDRILPGNYTPMVWGNEKWVAKEKTQGGHPSAMLKDGVLIFGAMGPWGGSEFNFRKQGSVSFIVPEDGLYEVAAKVRSKPWSGSKATAKLYVMKRDEQRVGVVEEFDLVANGDAIPISVEIDAAMGHEIVLLTEMPNHNSGATISISDLVVTGK